MLPLILDNRKINKGFCWDQLDITIDEELRIRLRKPHLSTLKDNDVTELWRFPGLEFKVIVLCPPKNKQLYIECVESCLRNLEHAEQDIAFRNYIFSGSPNRFDKQGRLSLTERLIRHSEIKRGSFMTIAGVGMWYEVWHYEALVDYLNSNSTNPFNA